MDATKLPISEATPLPLRVHRDISQHQPSAVDPIQGENPPFDTGLGADPDDRVQVSRRSGAISSSRARRSWDRRFITLSRFTRGRLSGSPSRVQSVGRMSMARAVAMRQSAHAYVASRGSRPRSCWCRSIGFRTRGDSDASCHPECCDNADGFGSKPRRVGSVVPCV